jgi:hypothetical protein
MEGGSKIADDYLYTIESKFLAIYDGTNYSYEIQSIVKTILT